MQAKMVDHPADYPWSSYGTNGQGKVNSAITPHDEYLRLGRSRNSRLSAYQELFRAHMEQTLIDQIRAATNGNYVLGKERFREEIARMLGRRVVPGQPERPRKER